MDVTKIRADIINYGDKIFFNSASSSLPTKSVLSKINEYLLEEHQLGGYKVEDIRKDEINEFYNQASILLNCKPRNIAFAFNSTDAYNKALSSIDFKKGDVIITSDDDYVSNQLQMIGLQKRIGVVIKRIKTLENGDLDIDDFKTLLEKYPPKLVAVTHVPTSSGLIQDVESIGAICHDKKVLFLLDACQSVGQLNVDVQKLKCDFLVVTGRKWLRGPRGTGLLFVSDHILNTEMFPMVMDAVGATWSQNNDFKLSETAKRFELFESSKALVAGFAEALKYLNQIKITTVEDRNQMLIKKLRENLKSIQDILLFDKGTKTSNILTFQKEGRTLNQIQEVLNKNDVFYSVTTKPYALIDFEKKGIDWAVRLSPHYFNTVEEIDKISEIIKSV